MLIWPWPGRDEAPATVSDALLLARALPASDDPFPTLDAAQQDNGVVLAGDHATGRVLAIVDDHADVRDFEEVIAAASTQGLFAYAASCRPGPGRRAPLRDTGRQLAASRDTSRTTRSSSAPPT